MQKEIIGFVGQMGVENPELKVKLKDSQYEKNAGSQKNIHYIGEMGSSYYTSSTAKKGFGSVSWNKTTSQLKPSDRENNRTLIKSYGGIKVDSITITEKFLDELKTENESIVYLSVRYGFGNARGDYEGLYLLKSLSDLQSIDNEVEYFIVSKDMLEKNAVFS